MMEKVNNQEYSEIKAEKLAEVVSGQLNGNPSRIINGASGIENSGPQTVTFAESDKLLKKAEQSAAGLVLISREMNSDIKDVIKVDNPRLAYARAASLFAPRPYYNPGIDERALIDDSVSLGSGVSIHSGVIIEKQAVIGDDVILAPGSYVGQGVEIGSGTVIHPRVVIEYGSVIGDNVIIQAGTVIGGDGFGYVSSPEGHTKIPQLGQVVIEDDVEIGANVCIDRAVSGKTIIAEGTKIDNLVQVAHNVKLGPDNLITGQVGIAGSSETGKRVTLAGQVGVSDHVRIGDDIIVGARGLVAGDLDKPGMYSGVPVQKHKKELREKAACRRIPKLMKKIKKLEKEIADLKKGE